MRPDLDLPFAPLPPRRGGLLRVGGRGADSNRGGLRGVVRVCYERPSAGDVLSTRRHSGPGSRCAGHAETYPIGRDAVKGRR